MSGTLGFYRGEIHAWTARLMGDYVPRLQQRAPRRAKEFNDPIWGTLVVAPLELDVLDSPVLQRLRRVRQLGVVHYVYGGANHTRLEHSLGVAHQVDQLVDGINEHVPQGEPPPIGPPTRNILRLAALCHDVGHGLMSHVSENALMNVEECEDLRLEFADEQGREDPKLSEIVAWLILESPAFEQLLESAASTHREHALPADPLTMVKRMINGLPVPGRVPLLHELISGPFDADKCDYMTRDAAMTGVPVVTDIPRLIRKVRAVTRPLSQLPDEIAAAVHAADETQTYTVIGVERSGARTLDELMLGRTLLFDKIYRHQKVRAAEVMVTSLLLELAAATNKSALMLAYELADEHLLDLDALQLVDTQRLDVVQGEMAVARDLSRRLRDRDLFVRAFAFAEYMPDDPYREDSQHKLGIQSLFEAATDSDLRGSLVRDIASVTADILARLGKEQLLDSVPGRDLKPYLWLDPPAAVSPVTTATDAGRAYLVNGTDRVSSFRSQFVGTRGWADAYLLTRDVGYVFTTRELAPYVYLASESVVRRRFGVRIPASVRAYAKEVGHLLDELRRELLESGFYDGAPFDLRPVPRILQRGDAGRRLDAVVRALGGYYGPDVSVETRGKGRIDTRHVRDWALQFQGEELVDAALRAAESIRLLGRAELSAALGGFVSENPEFSGGSLCPLGSTQDSSAVQVYYANDTARQCGLVTRSLLEALNSDGPIVFVDDFSGSGVQAANIVSGWLGLEPVRDLGETRELKLSPPLQVELRQRKLAFMFVAALDEGHYFLRQHLTQIELQDSIVWRHIAESTLPTIYDETLHADGPGKEEVVGSLRRIGEALLLSQGRAAEWASDRALGYGNRGLLVTFPYNTPSQTLTCLWAPGVVDGAPWLPLLPRRKKL